MHTLAVEPATDKIVLCGATIARLLPDGDLDTSFGTQGTGYVAFGVDSVPAFDACNRILAMHDGTIAYIGIRARDDTSGHDRAFVSGLKSGGTADLRFGSGTGASELEIGEVSGSPEWWFDQTSAFVRTRGGDALLTWMTATGLHLARVALGAGTGEDPPPPQATLLPASLPPPSPGSSAGGAGGGGAFTWFGLTCIVIAGVVARRSTARRTRR